LGLVQVPGVPGGTFRRWLGSNGSMQQSLENVVARASDIVVGKRQVIRLALACLVARGHLLIEDLPGVGKTTLAQVLARLLGLRFNRIQFTSDLLPADILGVAVYARETGSFKFHPGPIFAQVVLADEINRATPKAQSALLEAMEERQVTVEGETRELPVPFFVIATQNPLHQVGTFPLPESQLDRFLMRLEMGYPDAAAERELLRGADRRDLLAALTPCIDPLELLELQHRVPGIRVTDALLDYLQALLARSRSDPGYRNGLSPRAGLALLRSAQSWALLDGRDHVLPEDVQTVLPAVVGHRLLPASEGPSRLPIEVARELVEAVPIP
jgi:MoxR-like ATPase